MDAGSSTDYNLAGQVVLDYGSGEDALLRNLSGCTVTDAALWTVADEGRTLERLTRDVDGFRLSARIRLDSLIQNIPGSPDNELDLESWRVTGRPYGSVVHIVGCVASLSQTRSSTQRSETEKAVGSSHD